MLDNFQTKQSRPLETKDDSAPSNDTVREFMNAWEEFKSANNERLAQIETKLAEDPVTADKLSKIEADLAKQEDLNQRITRAESSAEALEELKQNIDRIETAMARTGAREDEAKSNRVETWARGVIAANLFGVMNLPDDQKTVLNAVNAEYKSLSVSTDTAGGYLAPTEYVREIIKGVTEMSPVRSLARVRTTGLKAIEIPKRTGQFAAQWVSEQGTKTETTGLAYGMEEIPTHEFYALIDISNQMIEDSAFSMESEISAETSEQFAVAEGKAFVSGTGVGQPQGFTDAGAGVGTVNSGSATKVTADGLLSLKYDIKSGYHSSANWVMNRTTMGSVRKLKDGNGDYIWQPGLAQGRPNTIDGDPYVEMPDMPNEGAGLKPVGYGDWRRAYTWVDRIQMEMLRDPYTQATAGNVRFIMRKRVGGQVTLAEAIRLQVCAA